MMILRLVVAFIVLNAAAAEAAGPTFVKVVITKAIAKKSIGTFDTGDAALVIGAVKSAGTAQPVSQTVGFKAGTAATITVGTAWRVGASTSPIRLLGVNIDLLDATDTVVASDAFSSVVDGWAHSTLTFSGLVPGGKYRVILTGTQTTAANYTMAIE